MADTNQVKSNYTNLSETYLYGKVTDRLNFYKYYKNDENSIDDPIFTGFTFDIDVLHSPLFYTGKGDLYISPDTLRDNFNEGTSSLAESIEKRLEYVYKTSIMGSSNGYEINSLPTKDIINYMENYSAGYGLQNNVYMDNVVYGASDYIYMVDKVSTDRFDEIEISDIGNGVPNQSIYATTNKLVENNREEFISNGGNPFDVPDDVELIDMKIENLKNLLNDNSAGSPSSVHIENENKVKRAQEDFENKKNEKDTYGRNYEEMKDFKSNLETSVDNEISAVKEEFDEIKYNMDIAFVKMKNSYSPDAMSEIDDIYIKFEDFCKRVSTDDGKEITEGGQSSDSVKYYDNIDVKIDDVSVLNENDFKKKEKEMTEFEKQEYDNKPEIKDRYIKVWRVQKAAMSTPVIKDSVHNTINSVKEKIKAKEIQLYGEENGVPCTQNNPSPTSLYGIVNDAKNKLKNDEYSQIKNQIYEQEEARNNYSNTQEYYRYIETRNEDIYQTSRVVDNANDNTDVSKKIYDVPQTVYDMFGFISGMLKLTRNYPYVMQSITGLDEAYRKYFNSKEPYMGSGDDKITITCFESLDLRVSSMFNKYFNAIYDRQYKRERVPINLRRFNCSVFVHDIRNFRHALGKYFPETTGGDDVKSKIVEIALNYVSGVEFKFYDCEIVPEETGSIFDNVTNDSQGDMRKTNFTFTYGNCVINFLPFEDLKRYYNNEGGTIGEQENDIYSKDDLNNGYDGNKQPVVKENTTDIENINKEDLKSSDVVNLGNINAGKNEKYIGDLIDAGNVNDSFNEYSDTRETYERELANISSGDFRRWFDKSSLGNVNNNDYREYIRHDSSVAVDDHYKSMIVNNFAMNSVVDKNRQLTEMDDALRKIVVGISASTGIPVKGVTDALNIGFIDPIINQNDMAHAAVIKDLGNVNNSKVVDEKTTEFVGKVDGFEEEAPDILKDLGNVHKK